MNYFVYLRKRFPLYCFSGIIFGLALFSLIATGRYHAHITGVLSDMETILLNKDTMKNQVRKIDDLDRYFQREFNLDIKSVNVERHIFQALDAMRARFQDAVINVNRFEPAGGTQELPVTISTPVRNYAVVLDSVQYLESFRIPDFEIRHLTVRKDQTGGVSMIINGAFVMPSFITGGRT
jgi:hypothetical protein